MRESDGVGKDRRNGTENAMPVAIKRDETRCAIFVYCE